MSILDLFKEFAGFRVLVTGGSRGIGAGIAQRLIDGGAAVAVTARARHDQTPAKAVFIQGDLRSKQGVDIIAAQAIKQLGGLDILVNNAGAARVHLPGSTAIPDEEWVDSLNINLLAVVRMVNATLPALKQSKSAAIVNISAVPTNAPPPPLAHYVAAKAGMNAYTRSLSAEFAALKIRVNAVTPGGVVTPGGDEVRRTITDALKIPPEALLSKIPLGVFGQPEDLAEFVSLVVSPTRGRWITGQNFYIDGGMSGAA
jgi:NAD(P)-dependent dehydrogenase (short-subunit alcohol dehydrogenase family)